MRERDIERMWRQVLQQCSKLKLSQAEIDAGRIEYRTHLKHKEVVVVEVEPSANATCSALPTASSALTGMARPTHPTTAGVALSSDSGDSGDNRNIRMPLIMRIKVKTGSNGSPSIGTSEFIVPSEKNINDGQSTESKVMKAEDLRNVMKKSRRGRPLEGFQNKCNYKFKKSTKNQQTSRPRSLEDHDNDLNKKLKNLKYTLELRPNKDVVLVRVRKSPIPAHAPPLPLNLKKGKEKFDLKPVSTSEPLNLTKKPEACLVPPLQATAVANGAAAAADVQWNVTSANLREAHLDMPMLEGDSTESYNAEDIDVMSKWLKEFDITHFGATSTNDDDQELSSADESQSGAQFKEILRVPSDCSTDVSDMLFSDNHQSSEKIKVAKKKLEKIKMKKNANKQTSEEGVHKVSMPAAKKDQETVGDESNFENLIELFSDASPSDSSNSTYSEIGSHENLGTIKLYGDQCKKLANDTGDIVPISDVATTKIILHKTNNSLLLLAAASESEPATLEDSTCGTVLSVAHNCNKSEQNKNSSCSVATRTQSVESEELQNKVDIALVPVSNDSIQTTPCSSLALTLQETPSTIFDSDRTMLKEAFSISSSSSDSGSSSSCTSSSSSGETVPESPSIGDTPKEYSPKQSEAEKSEVDSNLKTPLETENEYLNSTLDFEFEDDNDDVLSMTTSWNGSDDEDSSLVVSSAQEATESQSIVKQNQKRKVEDTAAPTSPQQSFKIPRVTKQDFKSMQTQSSRSPNNSQVLAERPTTPKVQSTSRFRKQGGGAAASFANSNNNQNKPMVNGGLLMQVVGAEPLNCVEPPILSTSPVYNLGPFSSVQLQQEPSFYYPSPNVMQQGVACYATVCGGNIVGSNNIAETPLPPYISSKVAATTPTIQPLLPQETTPIGHTTSNAVGLPTWLLDVFGVTCFAHLDNACPPGHYKRCRKSHLLRCLGDMQNKLFRLNERQLAHAYLLVRRIWVIFREALQLFINIYVSRSQSWNLLQLLHDCKRYASDECSKFFPIIYDALQQCGISPLLSAQFVADCMIDPRAYRFPTTYVNEILDIIMKNDWIEFDQTIATIGSLPDYSFPPQIISMIVNAALQDRCGSLAPRVFKMIGKINVANLKLEDNLPRITQLALKVKSLEDQSASGEAMQQARSQSLIQHVQTQPAIQLYDQICFDLNNHDPVNPDIFYSTCSDR